MDTNETPIPETTNEEDARGKAIVYLVVSFLIVLGVSVLLITQPLAQIIIVLIVSTIGAPKLVKKSASSEVQSDEFFVRCNKIGEGVLKFVKQLLDLILKPDAII